MSRQPELDTFGLGAGAAETAAVLPRDGANARVLQAALGLFVVTMFTGSSLLFLVQPMVARMVLPRLGGTPAVWNTCMLFFQASLLLGYLYAHVSTRCLGVKRQAQWHAVVLLLPLLFLPLAIGSGAPAAAESPVWWLLKTIAAAVGVPFFVISTSAPLLQRWFSVLPLPSAKDPYFLYAASNLGSMLALLGYPFLLEPALGVSHQTAFWAAGYLVFAVLTIACVWTVRSAGRGDRAAVRDVSLTAAPEIETISTWRRVRWVVLALVPSSLMLGVTAHISTDLAAVPLLWVLPLAMYLLTFVLAFSGRSLVRNSVMVMVAAPLVLACLLTVAINAHAWWFMALHLVTFFCCALLCHRELAAARPQVSHLTEFYLYVSFGGMLGGVFNTLVAPHLFSTVLEYPVMLAAVSFIVWPGVRASVRTWPVLVGYLVVFACAATWLSIDMSPDLSRFVFAITFGVLLTLAIAQGIVAFRVLSLLLIVVVVLGPSASGGTALFTARSFFGVLRVIEMPDHSTRMLRHGSTVHGRERIPSNGRCEASSYYHANGPVGQIVRSVGQRLNEVAIVGLGTGGMACYSAPGQHWTFFEIDPLVERIAKDASLFTHLQNAPGNVDVVIGDGRITLQRVPAGSYDMVVVDAFSSDAIPMHLLTREALQLYVSRLKPDGLLGIHISNRYLELQPVVASLAAREGLFTLTNDLGVIPPEDGKTGRELAQWVVISRGKEPLTALAARSDWHPPQVISADFEWTDDRSNILNVLGFH